MADETEVIISIRLDQQGASDEMEKVRKTMMDIAEQKKKLNEEYKKGKEGTDEAKMSQEQYIAELIKLEAAQKTATAKYKDLTKEQETNSNSINALRLANKRLLDERNNIDLSTIEGRKRLQEINEEYQKNTDAIKANVSGFEQQKMSIGDYTGALAQFFPMLGSVGSAMEVVSEVGEEVKNKFVELKDGASDAIKGFAGIGKEGEDAEGGLENVADGADGASTGILGMVKSSLAFIATPIGLTITALGLALMALNNYLKTTGEGEDLVAEKTASLNSVMKLYLDYVNVTIHYLLGAEDGFDKLEKKVGVFAYTAAAATFPMRMLIQGLMALSELAPGAQEGIELARGLDAAGDAAGMLALKEKEVRNEIQLLILKSKEKGVTDQESMAFLDKALQMEIDLNKEVKASKQENLRLGLEQIKIDSDRAFAGINLKQTNDQIARQLLEQGSITDDQRESIQNLLGDIEDAEATSIEIQQKIQNKEAMLQQAQEMRAAKAAENAAKEKAAKEKEAQEEADRRAKMAEAEMEQEQEMADFLAELDAEAAQRADDELTKALEQLELDKQNKAILLEQEIAFQQSIRDEIEATAKKEQDDAKAVKDAKIKYANEALEGIQSIAAEGTLLNKAAALTQIAIDTAEAISGLTASSEQNPANALTFGGAGVLQFASGLVRIFGNVAKAKSVIGFAEGGLSGTRINETHGIPITRSNGDNILATVRTGEVILNERQQAALGGANTFRRIGVPGFASGGMTGMDTLDASRFSRTSIQMDELMNSITRQRPVLVLEEFEYAATKKTSAERNAIIV